MYRSVLSVQKLEYETTMIQAEFSRKSNETEPPSSSCFANSHSSGYENIDRGRILKMDLNLLNDNYHSQPQCQDRTGGLPFAGNYALQVAASIASGDICSALILRSDSRKYTKKLNEGSGKESSRNQSTLPSTRCSTLRSFLSSSRSSSSGGTLKKEAKEEKRGFFSFFHWFRRRKLKRGRIEEDDYRRRRSNSVQSDTSISSSFHYVPVVYNTALSTGNSPIGDKKLILEEFEKKTDEEDNFASASNESTADEKEIDCQNEENQNIESVETNWDNAIHDSLKTAGCIAKYEVEMTCEGASSGIESNAKNKNRTRSSSTSTLHKKKRRAPPPPLEIKNDSVKCQIESETCLLPTSIANDSLNKKAIRQIKERARLKKKRRAPSPPYKTVGINTEEISQQSAVPNLVFQIDKIADDRKVDKAEADIQLNDLSKRCEGAEASAESTDNNVSEYQKNCLHVTEEWKMGNITTQKLIDMFNEMANHNENEVWNIPPIHVSKKESSTESDEINMSVRQETKSLGDKFDLLCVKEKTTSEKSFSDVENFKSPSEIRNLDEVEACIEALTSSFSDDANKKERGKCELHISENTIERKSAFDDNKSYQKSKLFHLQNKWKLNNGFDINGKKSSSTSHENQRKENKSDAQPTNDETSNHCVHKHECSGARPRLPQKNAKNSNHVSKIRCNLASDNEDKKYNEGRIGRNFSASFSSANRSRSQIDTRRNSNPNSSNPFSFDDAISNTSFGLLQQHSPSSPRLLENHQRKDRLKNGVFHEGKKADRDIEGDSENGVKVKVTVPRRSNLRRHRRPAQKSMFELQENNRDYRQMAGSDGPIREAYKKSLSLTSNCNRSLGAEPADSFNSQPSQVKKRSSSLTDSEGPRLLPDKSQKNVYDSLLNGASDSVTMAAKMVIKGQLWPPSYEIVAPELMFLRARLSGRKLPRCPKGGFANDELDAIEINKLLKQLEVAIGNGLVEKASNLARKLAEFKVKCSVVRKKSNVQAAGEEIAVNLFIEDRLSHTGPITLYINPTITVGQLKKKIEQEFDFPTYLQKWILGKKLAVDDNATISYFNVMNGCAVFLYLTVENPDRSVMYRRKLETYLQAIDSFDVDNLNCRAENVSDNKRKNDGSNFTETNLLKSSPKREEVPVGWNCPECTLLNDPTRPGCKACTTARPDDYQIPLEYKINPEEEERLQRERELEDEYQKEEERIQLEADRYKAENYQRFIELEEIGFVANVQTFVCSVCDGKVDVGEGITIRECLHNFCRECIANTIEYSETAEVKCPHFDDNYSCDKLLQDREIRGIVLPDIYEKHLLKSMKTAENQAGNSFHCQTPDCLGWCFYEDEVNQFPCPVCKHTNCLTCIAIHEGQNCKQYQERLTLESTTNENARKTKAVLDTMIREGNGMFCPGCGIIIVKKMGCDWLMCTMCKLEICWATKGPRWGPGGKGDTSGGCRCGIVGKCHYTCAYCH